MKLLGIDIGGTKTAVCAGTDKGKIIASKRLPTRKGFSPADYSSDIKELAAAVLADAKLTLSDIAAVGISAPGPLSTAKGMLLAPPNNPGWIDVPIVKMVSDLFHKPVFMNNDANAGALAEFMFGKYKGTKEIIYLTLSTGIGGGIITNGKLIQGVTDMGGEVGHHTLDINGPPCPCGRAGCFEVYVGGKNVADRLREKIRAGKIRTSILDKAGGDLSKIDHKALAAAAREGDAFAVAEWDVFIERLAQGVGNLMMIINPELIILGTIAVFEGEFLLAPLRERVKKYAWKWPIEACRIVPSSLGADIGNYAALAVGADGIRQG